MKTRTRFLCSLAALFSAGSLNAATHNDRPNILLIVADDLGYSDLGCYGGEIDTPHLDRLASSGLRYSQFRVTPMCLTSRIGLLSGMAHTAAGQNTFRYAVPLPQMLRDSGYSTSMSGKAHGFAPMVGNPQTDFGFDLHFGLNDGMSDFYFGNNKWVLNGKPFRDFGDDFYATRAITDYAIQFIGESLKEGRPFFSHIAYTAPHSPLQAPKEAVEKYLKRGVYARGWDVLREQRFARQKALGIIAADTALAEKGVEVPDWSNLPKRSDRPWELDRDFEELCMATYAAMVDIMDQNIGRIIAFLSDPDGDGSQSDSVLENTLIVFLSDNGAAYAGPYAQKIRTPGTKRDSVHANYGWGLLSNTPFKSYKHSSFEGGLRSPLVIHWPKGITHADGKILHESCSIWDLYPTFLEFAGAEYPGRFGKPDTRPLMGRSLAASFDTATTVSGGSNLFITSFPRSRGVYEQGWKIASYADSPWELYQVSEDPTERRNLREIYPEQFNRLIERWNQYAGNYEKGNTQEGTIRRGWGHDWGNKYLHLVDSIPALMADHVPLDGGLHLHFDAPLDFSGTVGKKIRLMRYGSSSILWEADPDEYHSCQGGNTVQFKDFPLLEAGTHYNITWDQGFAKLIQSGKSVPIPAVNETHVAFRFRTASGPADNR
jgi:arylsulfatase